MTWIVMTACAAMPSSCKGTYRRVALVQLTPEYAAENKRPLMISDRARGVKQLRDLGRHNVGKTDRCAYACILREAEAEAVKLNRNERRRRQRADRAFIISVATKGEDR
jgi:hypothetical protein